MALIDTSPQPNTRAYGGTKEWHWQGQQTATDIKTNEQGNSVSNNNRNEWQQMKQIKEMNELKALIVIVLLQGS